MHLTTYLVTYSIPYLDSDGTCWDLRYALITRSVNPSVVLERLKPLFPAFDRKIMSAMREEGRFKGDVTSEEQYFAVTITPLEFREDFAVIPGMALRHCARS